MTHLKQDLLEKEGVQESKEMNSPIVAFLDFYQMQNYCSKEYAKRIFKERYNGNLIGVHFTKSGNIRATFV